MRILVTGARGKVGAATIHTLIEAGHMVTGCDLLPPVYEAGDRGAHYFQADLTDAGEAYAAVRGHDVVVHAAALPEPTRNAPHTVFSNNLLATFNVAEACVRLGADRIVNVSSETVPGYAFAEIPFHAPYAPIDEALPNRPQDPYALAKLFGEQLMDAAVDRGRGLAAMTLRPSWVQWEGNYERSLGPIVRDPWNAPASANFWSYIDVYDLADALRHAAESSHTGHETMYIAAADNTAGQPLARLITHHYGEDVVVRELPREDAGGITTARAAELIGFAPTRSWRDYLDTDGTLRPEVRERLAHGQTGVQRGRAAIS